MNFSIKVRSLVLHSVLFEYSIEKDSKSKTYCEMAEKKVKIREATEFRVIDPQNAVKIIDADDLPNDLEASFETITTIDAFEKTVKNFPDHNALMVKDAATKKWNGISYKEYNERVKKLAKVFIKLGLQRHGTVAVLAFNCAEWFISELAAIYAG